MVVPKGKKIIKPVENAFLNFLERLLVCELDSALIDQRRYEQKIRPRPRSSIKSRLSVPPARVFDLPLPCHRIDEVQPAANKVKGKLTGKFHPRLETSSIA